MSDHDEQFLQSLNGVDKLLEHRLRLAICVLLTKFDTLSFSRLKELTQETDGNLGANLRKLEDAGYLGMRKSHVNRKPVTWYTLKEDGQVALRHHVESLTSVITNMGEKHNL